MILYTPLSETDIFPTKDGDYQNRHCVSYAGKQLYVQQTENGTYELLQLLSTDPKDFLNENYQPGTILQ